MKVGISWKWFDLWVGAYWDRKARALYVCLLPTVVLSFRRSNTASVARLRRELVDVDGEPVERDENGLYVKGLFRSNGWD